MATSAIAPAAPQVPVRRASPTVTPLLEHGIASRSDRVIATQQGRWGGTDAGKQIHHRESVIAPILGKTDQPPQRRVIAMTIRT